MKLNPYLNFDGNCREAMVFYHSCLGGEIAFIVTYADMPPGEDGPPEEGCAGAEFDMEKMGSLIAHMRLEVGDVVIMASDCPPGAYEQAAGTTCALQADSMEEAQRIFDALSQGGQVFMPFGPTSWAEAFGMFKDKFGIPWMVNFEGRKAA
ncbi:VOC family protein [Kordiimonas aestuarii]|uniref:VOC family protein n=1 Tax=Kordiimonas aestuarii TaxID=1005925 RepID=UPI0021D3C707|nr:VOC family protein [Kordiimonas aestuarii]